MSAIPLLVQQLTRIDFSSHSLIKLPQRVQNLVTVNAFSVIVRQDTRPTAPSVIAALTLRRSDLFAITVYHAVPSLITDYVSASVVLFIADLESATYRQTVDYYVTWTNLHANNFLTGKDGFQLLCC